MKGIHTEGTFEENIETALIEKGGYTKGHSQDFDAELGLFPSYITDFLQSSQPKAWEKIVTIHKSDAETKIIRRLIKELDLRGALDVLRKGFTDYGVKFKMAYLKPESSLNPEAFTLYEKNELKVVRQLYYQAVGKNSLDVVLVLNGLPISTIELKNQFSGQDVNNAKKQYVYDRKPSEAIFKFKKRALVHFAVDTDLCYMTTRLQGQSTYYLPFNLGHNNEKGNPPNPSGYRTAYLWESLPATADRPDGQAGVWTKDSILDLVGKFIHIEQENDVVIFPRFHQMEVVRKTTEHARTNGSGQNYLIQHSAGSGKSNSIAWLSYRLSSLHNARDERVFDSVIVITDRRVLDSQLQNTIYQFEHKDGVVVKIDKSSQQLADALTVGSNIIITTLQKFPFILDKIGELPSRKYAVIIDEAHSSQGGEATRKMKEVLSAKTLEEAEQEELKSGLNEDAEDEIRKSMLARGKQDNLSFFGFTATPKQKTVEVFGTPDESGIPKPFHLYSMKQAIEEGFIHDVLKHYTTYASYFKLSKQIEDDPDVNKKQASRAIARFLSLHPHNLAQKTEVMIEHFKQVVSRKLRGNAKAMVVTSSRLHALRYKEEFDKYIKEKGYPIKVLVAFSGSLVTDMYPDGVGESQVNGIKETELPRYFDKPEYNILIVASKYQTGFDQPKLHTMYVDKKLSGVLAVQTLSRLNRTTAKFCKEDTFVLDFANDADEILESFQPYYELTTVEETTDPNKLYDLKNTIEEAQIIWLSEVDNLCEVFYKSQKVLNKKDQQKLNAFIDPAVERFKQLPEEEDISGKITQDNLKHAIQVFCRAYSFLTQIMPFHDVDLEKLFTYSRYLLKKLPKKDQADRFQLGDEVELEYYRLQKLTEQSIAMDPAGEYGLMNSGEAGMRGKKEELALLSEIVDTLNKRFGTEFNEADKLFFEQIVEDCIADEKLQEAAQTNTEENFKYIGQEAVMNSLIERMAQNQTIFAKIMDDQSFGDEAKALIMKRVYHRLTNQRL